MHYQALLVVYFSAAAAGLPLFGTGTSTSGGFPGLGGAGTGSGTPSLPSGIPGLGSGTGTGTSGGFPGLGGAGTGSGIPSLPSGIPGLGSGTGTGTSGGFPGLGGASTGSGIPSLPSGIPGLGSGTGTGTSGGFPGLGGAGTGSGIPSLPSGIPGLGSGTGTGTSGGFPGLSTGTGTGTSGGFPGLGGAGTGSGLPSLPSGIPGLGSGTGTSGGFPGLGGDGTGSATPSLPTGIPGLGGDSTGSDAAADTSASTNTAAAAAGCKAVTVIFARGTTETGTLGNLVGPTLDKAVASALNNNAVVTGVAYAASAAGIAGEVSPQGGAGTQAMVKAVQDALSSCPDTQIVLSGYSQGAMLVHNTMSNLDATASGKVKAAVTFGDPFVGQAVKGLPDGAFKSFCASADTVCAAGVGTSPSSGGTQSGSTTGHLGYGSDTTAAATFIKGKVTV
ncbi:putative cutinase [Diaporthe ampelina]|uniref:Cutinase n=1 Tax=Diaporthe ampelina TaxID=1214573 RepID=A0A0G2IG14_9PEZI|nr:putative cutinase [Diaporthe ampelina]